MFALAVGVPLAMVPLPAACACSEESAPAEPDALPPCPCCLPAPSDGDATESPNTTCCGGSPGQPCDCPDCHAGEFAPLNATPGELRVAPQLVGSSLLLPALTIPHLVPTDYRLGLQQVYHVPPGPQLERLCRWLI